MRKTALGEIRLIFWLPTPRLKLPHHSAVLTVFKVIFVNLFAVPAAKRHLVTYYLLVVPVLLTLAIFYYGSGHVARLFGARGVAHIIRNVL